MSDYRFSVSEHDGTITRARLYRLGDEGGDSWRWYWEGDGQVAFIDGDRRDGVYALTDNEDTERAIAAFKAERDYDQSGALDRVAVRITEQSNARFICVGLDRGTDLYALAWGGDPNGEWRDEIEAVNWGDIYRIECEEFQPGFGVAGGDWVPADEYPEEFYGEDKAMAEFARIFPLTEFPADLLVTAGD